MTVFDGRNTISLTKRPFESYYGPQNTAIARKNTISSN